MDWTTSQRPITMGMAWRTIKIEWRSTTGRCLATCSQISRDRTPPIRQLWAANSNSRRVLRQATSETKSWPRVLENSWIKRPESWVSYRIWPAGRDSTAIFSRNSTPRTKRWRRQTKRVRKITLWRVIRGSHPSELSRDTISTVRAMIKRRCI